MYGLHGCLGLAGKDDLWITWADAKQEDGTSPSF